MADHTTPASDQLAAVTLNDDVSASTVKKHQFSDRVLIRSIVSRPDGGAGLAGQRVRVGGWVKTGREQGKGSFGFLEVNDGSCPANLQVIVDAAVADLAQLVQTGTSVSVEGLLKNPPEATKQRVELRVEKVIDVGTVDPAKYPIPKTKLSLEFLRDRQLQVETYACAVSNVYTFGPTFRAENSHTCRHLAEFWMVEPEIAFADLKDDMNCAEAYVKFMCHWLLDKCPDDMEFMAKNYDKTCIDRLRMVASTPFERISYTEAVELLLVTTEVKFQKPVIVYNYPKGIKAFYMRVNDDLNTVAAMDVLVPKVGELIGGSQREERIDIIKDRILEMGLPLHPYEWYLDLSHFGTVKHWGFGLGFERMILFATGIDNIRDVIPFPRYPGRADL
ncbi:hypothetical protein QYF36_006760 [Acer negundo]|nr:hypothetical protein QYF36_006760 [Acer negundo]